MPASSERLVTSSRRSASAPDVADRYGERRVGHVALESDAHVEAQDVAVGDHIRPGDAVHDHVVGRGADGAGKAAIAQEGRQAAAAADVLLGHAVELDRRDAGHDRAGELVEAAGQDGAGRGDAADFGL